MPKNGGESQLLELTLLSARDLAHVSKSMKAFAVVWIDPDRKLETRPDTKGQNSPSWNERFLFRLDTAGESPSSAVNIEIYAQTSTMSRRVSSSDAVPVGSVSVLVSSLFPSDDPTAGDEPSLSEMKRTWHHRRSRMRFLTLQLRRPSGRPQGVVDLGVAFLDGTRRSMPLSGSELSASVTLADQSDVLAAGEDDRQRRISDAAANNRYQSHRSNKFRRSKSERSISEVYLLKPAATESDSVVSESAVNYYTGANNKMRDSVSSDVGPSPSVVAAAIAMGVYPTNNNKKRLTDDKALVPAPPAESSILEDWVEEEDDDSVEGLKTKIERWRSEIHPLYQSTNVNNNVNNNDMMMVRRSTYKKNQYGSGDMAAGAAQAATPSKRGHRRGNSGLFSCFGTAYGCEFSITCGGKSGRKKKSNVGDGGDDDFDDDDEGPISLSELHYGDQYV